MLLMVPLNAAQLLRKVFHDCLSQLLQALSNNIRFKEPGMKTLNSFVTNVGLLAIDDSSRICADVLGTCSTSST